MLQTPGRGSPTRTDHSPFFFPVRPRSKSSFRRSPSSSVKGTPRVQEVLGELVHPTGSGTGGKKGTDPIHSVRRRGKRMPRVVDGEVCKGGNTAGEEGEHPTLSGPVPKFDTQGHQDAKDTIRVLGSSRGDGCDAIWWYSAWDETWRGGQGRTIEGTIQRRSASIDRMPRSGARAYAVPASTTKPRRRNHAQHPTGSDRPCPEGPLRLPSFGRSHPNLR